ncbi:MAG: CNNM domain-containing protein [Planctomycetaceae bacterium]
MNLWPWLPEFGAMIGLIGVSAFFSGSETALFYLSRDELRLMQVGRPRERVAAELLKDPDRLLTAVLFWNLLVNLSFFAISLITSRGLVNAGHTGTAGIVGVVSVGGLILGGEVLPKSLAVLYRQRIAEMVAWPLAFSVRIVSPIMPMLAGITVGIRRAFWPNLKAENYLDADDLERALESLPAGQGIVPFERDVLHRILNLSQITAEEAMRPRGSYVVFKPPVGLKDIVGQMKGIDYLFLQEGEPGEIGGVVALHARFEVVAANLEQFAEPVIHVPWCATLADVLQRFQEEHCRMAVVVSEYGETVGVLAEEDLLDTVLAPEPSRARRLLQREPVLEVAPGTWHVDGLTTLRYLARKLELEYDADDDESVTVNGLFQEQLERFPQIGDTVNWMEHSFKVFDTNGRDKLRAIVTRQTSES